MYIYKTTDPQDELFDIVNESDKVISKATRKEVHQDKNLIHRSVGIAVLNAKGELYLQKRSATKDTSPGEWTISSSGHVAHGKDYQETAIRELEEELGVILNELSLVTKYLCRAPYETEMVTLYKCKYDGPIVINNEEIEEGRFFSKKSVSEEVHAGRIKLSYTGKIALGKLGWLKMRRKIIIDNFPKLD